MYEYPPYDFPWGTLIFGICFQIAMNAWAAWWLLRKAHKPEILDPAGWSPMGVATYIGLELIYASILSGDPRHPQWLAFSLMLAQILISLLGMSFSLWRLYDASKSVGHGFVAGVLSPVVVLIGCCLIPPTSGARESARRTQCKNNLKQIGFAFHNYHDAHDSFPAQQLGDPPRSWRVELLPYLDQQTLYDRYDKGLAWDEGTNNEVARTRVADLTCPSAYSIWEKTNRGYPPAKKNEPVPTAYAVPVLEGGIYDGSSPLTIRQITDGTSSTFLVVEACGQNIPWAEPRDILVTEDAFGVNLPSPERGASPAILSSHHWGGAQVAMADGSVRFISQRIDPETLKLLVNARDGQVIGEW